MQIWGTAEGGADVTVSFNGQEVGATAKDGKSSVALKPLEPGGPFKLTIAGPENKIELKNILVGDVWIAGGQSNMDMSVENFVNARATIADSTNSQIRLLWFDHRGSPKPESEIGAARGPNADRTPSGISPPWPISSAAICKGNCMCRSG